MEIFISERIVEGVTILDCRGRLIGDKPVATLRRSVGRQLTADCRRLLINMAEVPYIDAAGVGGLAACYIEVNRNKGEIWLIGAPPKVRQILALTKVIKFFRLHHDVEAALQALQA